MLSSRRQTMLQLAAVTALLDSGSRLVQPAAAQAALVQFPTSRLKNRYVLVRSCLLQA